MGEETKPRGEGVVPPSPSSTRLFARAGSWFGSPLVLATSLVCVVAATGLFSTISTYRSLRRSGERHAERLLRERADSLRRTFDDALSVSDVMLARLEPQLAKTSATDPIEPTLVALRDAALARHGVTWASASFPDGTFLGVTLDERGELFGQESRVDPDVERHYRFGRAGLERILERPTHYDPRTRGFYRLATSREGRVWTEPYPFLPNLRTGVTRAVAVHRVAGDGRELAAVLTIDFDASELAKLLGPRVTASERTVVTVRDAVLATRGVRQPDLVHRSVDRPLRIADLDDATVTRASRSRVSEVVDGGVTFRVARADVGRIGPDRIELLSVVPERELYASAYAEARSGMIATAVVSLVGLLLATALSANVARLRRKRELAELDAARARAEADDLGTYTLVSRIGSGGMGEVYRARHKLLARDAALKLIKADSTEDEDARAHRFFEEARTLASMRSIHTVSVYDFGIASDGRYYLAMELLDGLDLDQLVRRHGPQPPARVASILAQVCDSLAEAHAAGLVHQDVKPANIFLCRLAESLDVVKVLDFGLSRAVRKRRRDDDFVEGTPAFMAPEQALGEDVTARADLYAVGCVAYFLLSGRYPYPTKDSSEAMRAHVSAPIPSLPDVIAATTPAELLQLVTRCLAKKPEARPTSASAMASALRRIHAACEATFTDADRRVFWEHRSPGRGEVDVPGRPTVRAARVPAAPRQSR